jgi:hypothetical protein
MRKRRTVYFGKCCCLQHIMPSGPIALRLWINKNIHIYNFVFCFAWLRNLVSDINGSIGTEVV